MNRISVVIPAFNASRTIAETLLSVARQTRQAAEIIVVDDGSSDNTAEVARTFTATIPGLTVIVTPNRGASSARNTAIRAATGDILAPLDADDLWHPAYLARLASKLESKGETAAFAYAHFRRVNEEGRVHEQNFIVGVDGIGFYRLLVINFVGNGSNYVMWRRRVVDAGGFDENLIGSEDYDLQLRLAWTGEIGHVDERLVAYRNLPNSLSKRWRDMVVAGLKMLDKLDTTVPARAAPLRWARAWHHLNFHHIIKDREQGNMLERSRHLLLAMAYDPYAYSYKLGAIGKGKIVARLRRNDSAPPAPPSPVLHASFFDLDPATAWDPRLPTFFRRRLQTSRKFDLERAAELGI